jgi:hypothetical protein
MYPFTFCQHLYASGFLISANRIFCQDKRSFRSLPAALTIAFPFPIAMEHFRRLLSGKCKKRAHQHFD